MQNSPSVKENAASLHCNVISGSKNSPIYITPDFSISQIKSKFDSRFYAANCRPRIDRRQITGSTIKPTNPSSRDPSEKNADFEKVCKVGQSLTADYFQNDEMRSGAVMRITPKCRKCRRFIDNSNCSSSGRIGDAERGLLLCDKCIQQIEIGNLKP